jgi:hypothetical protein
MPKIPVQNELSNLSLPQKVEVINLRLQQLEEMFGSLNYDVRRVAQSEINDRLVFLSQSENMYGIHTALCIETIDIWKQGRIRYFSPVFHDPKQPIKKLPWAWAVSPFGGFDDSGAPWVPPAGSTVCLLFENGVRDSPYYIGTAWHRNRGPGGSKWPIGIQEFDQVSKGHRKGYLCGPNDESQVLPPWNTENYNGFDIHTLADFDQNPDAQKRITVPNIYGFKTPEKHMMKLVDGDPRCNRRWKRIEILSGCGNWMIFKDDHLHYAGQWAHPRCGVDPGDTSCVKGVSDPNPSEDITQFTGINATGSVSENESTASPIPGTKKEDVPCDGQVSNKTIIGGHPRTPRIRRYQDTKYSKSQKGANPFFKHQNECRPYKGPGTPQNNKADLPQSGIQFLSLSGHTWVMDDSVEEPSGAPTWERSLQDFDFGCNDKYLGRIYLKTATGHGVEMSDVEDDNQVRGMNNYIRILTATGNMIELNDHTIDKGGQGSCPPNEAGKYRGITMETTSTHLFQMIDEGNKQCGPKRKEGGVPDNLANKAYIMIRSGYGLEFYMGDDDSQRETKKQYIQIYSPQKDNTVRKAHIMRFQERPSGPGQIFLRAGGDYIVVTYDMMVEMVGDKVANPSDKLEIISRTKIVDCDKFYINLADTHLFLAKKTISLLAGSSVDDCLEIDGTHGPCIGGVLVAMGGKIRISDRVFASASRKSQVASIFSMSTDPLPLF